MLSESEDTDLYETILAGDDDEGSNTDSASHTEAPRRQVRRKHGELPFAERKMLRRQKAEFRRFRPSQSQQQLSQATTSTPSAVSGRQRPNALSRNPSMSIFYQPYSGVATSTVHQPSSIIQDDKHSRLGVTLPTMPTTRDRSGSKPNQAPSITASSVKKQPTFRLSAYCTCERYNLAALIAHARSAGAARAIAAKAAAAEAEAGTNSRGETGAERGPIEKSDETRNEGRIIKAPVATNLGVSTQRITNKTLINMNPSNLSSGLPQVGNTSTRTEDNLSSQGPSSSNNNPNNDDKKSPQNLNTSNIGTPLKGILKVRHPPHVEDNTQLDTTSSYPTISPSNANAPSSTRVLFNPPASSASSPSSSSSSTSPSTLSPSLLPDDHAPPITSSPIPESTTPPTPSLSPSTPSSLSSPKADELGPPLSLPGLAIVTGTYSSIADDVVMVAPAGGQPRHVFVFEYGSLVFFNVSEDEEKQWIRQLSFFQDMLRPLTPSELESGKEELIYTYALPGRDFSAKNDTITLRSRHIFEKLSVAFALAQAVKLNVFEARVEAAILRNERISYNLANKGVTGLTKAEASKRMVSIDLMCLH